MKKFFVIIMLLSACRILSMNCEELHLALAARCCSLEYLEKNVTAENVNIPLENSSLLQLVASSDRLHNVKEAMKLLCKHGADINYQDPDGNTALHCAAGKESVVAIQTLLKAGAKRDLKNNNQKMPWQIVQKSRSCEVRRNLPMPWSCYLRNVIQNIIKRLEKESIT